MKPRYCYILIVAAALLQGAAAVFAQAAVEGAGTGLFGSWKVHGSIDAAEWKPGREISLEVELLLSRDIAQKAGAAGIVPDNAVLMVTAERSFDPSGWLRLASDERMSTILTPSGLAIEGGWQSALSQRTGFSFKTPLELFGRGKLEPVGPDEPLFPGGTRSRFTFKTSLPMDLPPGLYRLRVDAGLAVKNRLYSLWGGAFASRPAADDKGSVSTFCSRLFPASAPGADGTMVDARTIKARLPWVILGDYNSNGSRGVVAREDSRSFALSSRNIIPDETVLPLLDLQGRKLSYSLEPSFPFDSIDPGTRFSWNPVRGEIGAVVTAPDGRLTRIGPFPVAAWKGLGPTTKRRELGAWLPQGYGHYEVRLEGWVEDSSGRRFEGGGSYGFWIAKRMTMATATFQGMPYPVGSKYGRDTVFIPSLPARVKVDCELYPDSEPSRVKRLSYEGQATAAGLYGAAQGMKPFPLDEAGEYFASILATATDGEGALWVCSMRHAGIVYSPTSGIVAHGKKLKVDKDYLERGETLTEGWDRSEGLERQLQHITFPYNAGDVLLIASEGSGANKIEPVLTWTYRDEAASAAAPEALRKAAQASKTALFGPGSTAGSSDAQIAGVGRSNCRIRTSNGYPPHLYPEYITSMEYYYGSAPRPGFMSRFVVGEDGFKAPYWPTSKTNFGAQAGASPMGDLPGDIYRLLGGVVVRHSGYATQYSPYIANAFILPKDTRNNRVIEAGSEDLIGPDGKGHRFYLVGLRPGSIYSAGAPMTAVVQIDPILPVHIRYTLIWPDGHRRMVEGKGDEFGYFAGSERWILDQAGVYRYTLEADWQGMPGVMPGLPSQGGYIFVTDPQLVAAGSVDALSSASAAPAASGLRLDTAERSFDPVKGLSLTGRSQAAKVYYVTLMPGAVLEQGELPVAKGRFSYHFDPQALAASFPIYDIQNILSGKPEQGRLVHITFFSEEPDGKAGFSRAFEKLILRGESVVQTGPR